MEENELRKNVTAQLRANIPNEDIIVSLISQGLSEEDSKKLINEANKTNNEATELNMDWFDNPPSGHAENNGKSSAPISPSINEGSRHSTLPPRHLSLAKPKGILRTFGVATSLFVGINLAGLAITNFITTYNNTYGSKSNDIVSVPSKPIDQFNLPTPAIDSQEEIQQLLTEQIISYEGNKITINPISGYGLMPYVSLIVENDPSTLAKLTFDEQKKLLAKEQKSLSKTKNFENLLHTLEDIVQENPNDIYHQNLTLAGLKDPKQNIIYVGVPLELTIDVHSDDSMKTLVQEYLALRTNSDEENLTPVLKKIALKYNLETETGIISELDFDNSLSTDNRQILANDLYRVSSDRREFDSFMLPEEIIYFVNYGHDTKISQLSLYQEEVFEISPPEKVAKPERKSPKPIKKKSNLLEILQKAPKLDLPVPVTTPIAEAPVAIASEPSLTDSSLLAASGVHNNHEEVVITATDMVQLHESPAYTPIIKSPKDLQMSDAITEYLNLLEIIFENPGTAENISKAETILRPVLVRIYGEHKKGNLRNLNLNPLSEPVRLTLAKDLLSLNAFTKDEISSIVNSGYSPQEEAYISDIDFDSLIGSNKYQIFTPAKTSQDLEAILLEAGKSYESPGEKNNFLMVDLYLRSHELETEKVIVSHEASEKLLEYIVSTYKQGDTAHLQLLDRSQRLAMASQLSASAYFADKRKSFYLDNKEILAFVNHNVTENLITEQEIRQTAKKEYGITRKAAIDLAIENRRKEAFELYTIACTDNPALTPYQFSKTKEAQEMLNVSSSTILRDLNRYSSSNK